MNPRGFLRKVSLAATLTASTFAFATPAHNVCVPQAIGVPSRSGPPDWMGWTGGTGLVEPALDDPRWLGASGQTFSTGGALAPLHTRMLWATTGTTKYLYLSFLVDLDGVSGAGLTTPRDLFVGFRRPSAFNNGTHNEYGYIFQFHLNGGGEGSTTDLITPVHCATFTDCAEIPGPGKNFWRVFVDHDEHDSCVVGTTTYNGPAFRALTGSFTDSAPIDWMTNTTPAGQDAVRYWKLDASQPGAIQNRWAVQVRMKLATTDTESLENGIAPSSTFWYQSAAKLTGGDLYAAIAWWPRELVDPVCVSSLTPNSLVHPQLGDATSCAGSSTTSTCSPDNYSRFETYNFGARPSDCDAGISIDTPYIGSVVAASGTDFTTVNPTTSFKGNATNTVLAQVVNLGSANVSAPILARFRLAGWGTAPWITSTDHGVWKDMRGAENGVCGAGSAPAGCTASSIPHFVDADFDGLADTRAPIKFNWTIGDSSALGNSEFCKFSLNVPGAVAPDTGCTSCVCNHVTDPSGKCDADGDTGTRATIPSAANPTPPCVSKRIEHECMFVELSAPNGGVQFAQQSSWNNMNFEQMSTVSREALIDARQLPKRPGQVDQDIYLIAMPRNMPSTIPGGPSDGASFVRERSLERAEITAAPYVNDLGRLTPQQIEDIEKKLGRGGVNIAALTHTAGAASSQGDDKGFRDRIQRVARALVIMPDKDFKRTVGLLTLALSNQSSADLNQSVVTTVGAEEAAGIVPTLEIYPFYQPLGQGLAYLPMTAFTVFLGHEGSMSGMTWLIDGATKVGQNIYHMTIPVGFARRIQVRAQAIQPPEAAIGPNNPRWPCAGCACGGVGAQKCGLVTMIGNTAPGLIAGVLVIRRRRKQTAKAAKPAS
jgi:hypothetical protein